MIDFKTQLPYEKVHQLFILNTKKVQTGPIHRIANNLLHKTRFVLSLMHTTDSGLKSSCHIPLSQLNLYQTGGCEILPLRVCTCV